MNANMNVSIDTRRNELAELGQRVCSVLEQEIVKLGLDDNAPPRVDFAAADCRLEKDTGSGEDCLMGEWRDDKGHMLGNFVFHADGSFFAEYDVVRAHPQQPRFFVEAVTAWGRYNTIKSEPRLIAYAG